MVDPTMNETDKQLQSAQNPNTPPEELATLATHPSLSVRHAVTQNPNTPKETLYKLAADFPDAFLQNPALPLLLLESPDFFIRMPWQTSKRLLARANLPVQIVEALLGHRDSPIRVKAAAHPQLSPDRLRALSQYQDEEICLGVASNRNTPPDILSAIYKKSLRVRSAVASNPSAPPSLLVLLAGDFAVWAQVANNPGAPATLLTQLATHESLDVRENVARNSAAPLSVLQLLAKDKDYEVRETLAENPTTPTDILELLLQDEDKDVRELATESLRAGPGSQLNPEDPNYEARSLEKHKKKVERRAKKRRRNLKIDRPDF